MKSSLLTNIGHKIRTSWLLMRIWARILGVSHPAVSPEGVKTSHGVYMVFGAGWTVSGGTEWLLETVERLLVLGLTH